MSVQYFKVHIDNLREKREQTKPGKVALKFLWLLCTGGRLCILYMSVYVCAINSTYLVQLKEFQRWKNLASTPYAVISKCILLQYNTQYTDEVLLIPSLFPARNAVVVMIGALVGYTLTTQAWFTDQLSLITTDRFSLPVPQPPNVTLHSVQVYMYVHIICTHIYTLHTHTHTPKRT